MKTIHFSAEETLIEEASSWAQKKRTTLDHLFQDWLTSLAKQHEKEARLNEWFRRMDYADAGGPFNRTEMNER